MRSPRRVLVTAVALLSVAVTVLLFIRETTPPRVTQLAAARAHLSDTDLRALSAPIDYRDAVPVLEFSDVSSRGGASSVTPSQFATAVTALRRAGFSTVSLATVRDLVAQRHPSLPSRPLLITFDDGIATEYTTADPILKAAGFTAVSFVDPARLGDGRRPSYYLSRPQVTAMTRSGRWDVELHADSAIRFASHVRTPLAVDAHSDPQRLPRLDVTAEMDVPGLFAALRRMVPSPPATSLSGWDISGDACDVSGDRLSVRAVGYALCRAQLNGGQWTDYRMQATVTGLADRTTLVVICRANRDGELEVSVGSRLAVLRALVRGRYVTLGQWPTTPPGAGGSHTVSVEVVGLRASVTVDGMALGQARIAGALGYGGPGFGVAGGGAITVTASVTDLRVPPAGR